MPCVYPETPVGTPYLFRRPAIRTPKRTRRRLLFCASTYGRGSTQSSTASSPCPAARPAVLGAAGAARCARSASSLPAPAPPRQRERRVGDTSQPAPVEPRLLYSSACAAHRRGLPVFRRWSPLWTACTRTPGPAAAVPGNVLAGAGAVSSSAVAPAGGRCSHPSLTIRRRRAAGLAVARSGTAQGLRLGGRVFATPGATYCDVGCSAAAAAQHLTSPGHQ